MLKLRIVILKSSRCSEFPFFRFIAWFDDLESKLYPKDVFHKSLYCWLFLVLVLTFNFSLILFHALPKNIVSILENVYLRKLSTRQVSNTVIFRLILVGLQIDTVLRVGAPAVLLTHNTYTQISDALNLKLHRWFLCHYRETRKQYQ